jgi:hypothetical protein
VGNIDEKSHDCRVAGRLSRHRDAPRSTSGTKKAFLLLAPTAKSDDASFDQSLRSP